MIGTGSILSVSRVITHVGHTEGPRGPLYNPAMVHDAREYSGLNEDIAVDHAVNKGTNRCCLHAGKSSRGASLIEFPVAIILRFYTGNGHA